MRKSILLITILFFYSTFLSAEAVKVSEDTPLKYFELYGYFSFNHNFSYNYSLNGNNPYFTQSINELEINETNNQKKTIPDKDKSASWAFMKLHLEPVINIAETMKIHTKFSIFGSKVLGTENQYGNINGNVLQNQYQQERNPSILFEGLWSTFDSPLGTIMIGRQPFHWGLGILYNDGNNLFSQTTGDYLDRISVIIPFSGFKIIPAYDFNSEGLVKNYQDRFMDATDKDDGWQLSLMFMKTEDDPKLLEEKLQKEETVYEFGAMAMYSWQTNRLIDYDETNDALTVPDSNIIDDSKKYILVGQDAKLWTLDTWFNFYYKNFSIKFEGALQFSGVLGKYIASSDNSKKEITAEMWGAALEAKYKIIPNKFNFTLFAGIASGDDQTGIMGDSWNIPGNAIDSRNFKDLAVNNFRFHKDYFINSVVWDHILGRFTGGGYVSGALQYYVLEDLNVKGGFTYSYALMPEYSLNGHGRGIAFEPFASTEYADKSGLRLGLKYQIGVPFDGLAEYDDASKDLRDAEFFFLLHTYVGFVF